MEEGRAEQPGGEMVRESCEKPGEEAKENGTAGRAGESHHHPERQHQVYHHPEVSPSKTHSVLALILRLDLKNRSTAFSGVYCPGVCSSGRNHGLLYGLQADQKFHFFSVKHH